MLKFQSPVTQYQTIKPTNRMSKEKYFGQQPWSHCPETRQTGPRKRPNTRDCNQSGLGLKQMPFRELLEH